METKSFATFKDGHTEDILYFERKNECAVLFTTKSGMYLYKKGVIPECVAGMRVSTDFFRLNMRFSKFLDRRGGDITQLTCEENYDIQSITLDERVPYEFSIYADGVYITGEVMAAQDASEEEVRKLVLDDLDISIEKKE